MEGKLKKGTFRSSDGQVCYKLKSNVRKTKIYFRCKMFHKGYGVRIHTNYMDKLEDYFYVHHRRGIHNHSSTQGESRTNPSRCNPSNESNNTSRKSNPNNESNNTLNSTPQNVFPPVKYVVYVNQ